LYSLVSFLFVVLLTVPPHAQPFVKVGAHAPGAPWSRPRAPWSRRHWLHWDCVLCVLIAAEITEDDDVLLSSVLIHVIRYPE